MMRKNNGVPSETATTRRLENGQPGDVVLVAVEPDLADELRALGARVACQTRDDAGLAAFVDRRRVIVAIRHRGSLMAAYQTRSYLAERLHPESVRVLDLESSFRIVGDFVPWWLAEVEANNYEGLHQFVDVAWERATAPAAASAESEPWPELSLREKVAVPAFPVEVFPEALRGFCRAAAGVSGGPVDFAGVAMLAAASAAVGRSCQLFIKRDWSQGACLYLVIVAEPGRAKSPSVRHPLAPLSRIDRDLRARSKRDKADWEDAKRNVPKGQPAPPEPPQRRKVVKDITRESLVTILADNPRGVLADPDELSAWLNGMNEYKGRGADLQFWLSQWNGDPISVDREGGRRSSYVPAPMCTVLGGLQPGILGMLHEQAGNNDGFVDRLLFSFPDVFPAREWLDDDIPEASRDAWADAVGRLDAIAMRYDVAESQEKPWPIAMHPDAYSAWKSWFNAHGAEMDDPDSPKWRAGVYAKLWNYCARFALILSRLRLAAGGESEAALTQAPVLVGDVEAAVRLVDYFKGHAEKVHSRSTGGTGDPDADAVLAWIRRKHLESFREREVRKDLTRRFPTADELRVPLAVLIRAGAIRPVLEDRDPSKTGRKPTPLYEVNPCVLRAGATEE